MVTSLRKATYTGRYPKSERTPFVYAVTPQGVYFSATAYKHHTPSVGAAQVILEVCELEELDWHSTRFFEVWTYRGYPGLRIGACRVKQLVVNEEEDKPAVHSWSMIAQADARGQSDTDIAEAIPEEVRDLFLELIG